jgi:hypothetical protein
MVYFNGQIHEKWKAVKAEQKSIGKMAGNVGYIKEDKTTVKPGSIKKERRYFQFDNEIP